MEDKLRGFIDSLKTLKERNLQLDLFRNNGEVLMQIYKQKDVNEWDIGFFSEDVDGLVIELSFHKDKTNNKENFKRFDLCPFSKQFVQVDKSDFFMKISSEEKTQCIHELVINLLKTVYDLSNESFYYTLNAY